ncbi:MAG: glycosyltransferase family 39 protein [Caldilineales bacterium]|nr:glycosyltransferase family 39 protein [Caldilineales bacterium]
MNPPHHILLHAARRAPRGLWLLLGLFLALALLYNGVTPIGEADNELSHYRYIQYVKANRSLPRTDAALPLAPVADQCLDPAQGLDDAARWQFRQPPLYYILAAATLFWADSSDYWWPTPNQYGYHAGAVDGGRNAFLHTTAETIGDNAVVRSVKLHRLFSTLIGLLGLIAVYRSGRLLFPGPGRTGPLLLTAAVAFVPSYIFAAATINNDILVGVLGLWGLYFCLRSVWATPDLRAFALAALLFALAFLTKYTAIVFIPIFLLTTAVLLWRSWRLSRGRLLKTATALAALLAAQALIILWWFLRNQQVYGEAIIGYENASASWIERLTLTTLPAGADLTDAWIEGIRFTFNTYWGLLGADSITLPPWQLTLLTLITALAGLGLLWEFLARRSNGRRRLLVFLGLGVLLLDWYIVFSLLFYGGRGRYLLGLFSIFGFLYLLGSQAWRTRRFPWLGGYLYAGVLLAISLLAPFLVLRPTYAPPPLAASADLLPGEQPVHARVGDLAELVGMGVVPGDVAPYEAVDVTLVWRALAATPNNYVIGVHLIGVDQTYFGGASHLSANGAYPTSSWQPGDVFRDTYRVYAGAGGGALLPTGARIKVSVVCPVGDEAPHLPIFSPTDEPLGDAVYSGLLRLGLPAPPPADSPPLARFGDELALISISDLPTALEGAGAHEFAFRWQALQQPAQDYSVFVQLLDADNTLVLGADFPLTQGYYPSHLWQPGEIVEHRHPVDFAPLISLPAGAYRLIMGVYDLESGQRLPLTETASARDGDAYDIGVWQLQHFLTYIPWVITPTEAAEATE